MKSFYKTTVQQFTIRFVAKDFMTYTEEFREIRSGFEYRGDECFKCGHKFTIGEQMSLVALEETANKMLCASCAKELNGESVKKGENATV